MDDIVTFAKSIDVSPAKGGKAPVFRGSAGEIHTRIAEEMAATLADDYDPPYIDGTAQTLLEAARATALHAGVIAPGYILRDDSVQWFPWLGTRGLLTLELHARCDELEAERDQLSITYKKTDPVRWRAHLETIVRSDRTNLDLAQRMEVKTFDKFDGLLDEELLDQANARNRLDLHGSKIRAEEAIQALDKTSPS